MNVRRLCAIYIYHDDKVLLMYKTNSRIFSKPLWISVGGHFENTDNNDPERCIIREMCEETGLILDQLSNFRLKYVTQRKTQTELRQQYIFMANLNDDFNSKIIQSGEGRLEWVPNSELFNRNMSVTNTALLKHYFDIGSNDDFIYSGIATMKNNEPFIEFIKLIEFDVCY